MFFFFRNVDFYQCFLYFRKCFVLEKEYQREIVFFFSYFDFGYSFLFLFVFCLKVVDFGWVREIKVLGMSM